MASRLDECFKQGTAARKKRRKLADNPYDIDTEEHTEWAAGWRATFDLDEDVDAASMRIDAGTTPGELAGPKPTARRKPD